MSIADTGLGEVVIRMIQDLFRTHPEVEEVWLYGSRAKGNYKTGSDIDLCMTGERLNHRLLATINRELDDLPIPYTIDLSMRNQISNPNLLEHIDRVGKLFYRRTPS